MKIGQSKLTFTGYSNALALKTESGNNEHLVLAMQLNDNDGYKDLSEFRDIKRRLGIFSDEYVNKDTITVTYSENKPLKLSMFDIENVSLLTGEELLKAESSKIDLAGYNYKEVENLHMRVYTFLAGITKRLASENNLQTSKSGLDYVKQSVFYNFTDKYRDLFSAAYKALVLKSERLHVQPVAQAFNEIISHSLEAFF